MSEAATPMLVWCPFPDTGAAEAAANTVLDEGLAACVNIMPEMRSLYVWNGERGEGSEAGALFKTNADLIETLVARLLRIHPYTEPAILGWRCDVAAPGTATWLGSLGR